MSGKADVRTTFRVVLLPCLVLCSAALLFATARTADTVARLADLSLEGTALALSSAAEAALRAPAGADDAVREVLADRVVAYALIADRDGSVLFHTNPRLAGSRLPDGEAPAARLDAGTPGGRRIVLGTGLPAYAYDYVLHRPDGSAELLRLVLHTGSADRILAGSRRAWAATAAVLVLLWVVGALLDRAVGRAVALQAESDRRERLALVGRMTATLAHEIRNALGSVKGYTQWAAEKIPPTDPARAGLGLALQGSQRIEALVNDLLRYAREETYDVGTVDAASLLREAAEAAAWEGTARVDAEAGLALRADREKLARVLGNGIRNAVEAMGAGGTLILSARREGGEAVLRIEDTGPGIPEAEMPRLFTPFHTTKADGTGLGLAYSRKVVDGMGGTIALTNRPEGGAVLAVRLPAVKGG